MEFNYRDPQQLFAAYLKDFPSLELYYYEDAHNRVLQSDKEWSKRNLGYFCKEGEKAGFQSFMTGKEHEYSGFDLCWYCGYPPNTASRIDDWNREPKHMELALEHEMKKGAKQAYYAFSKLCDVKAYTKVLICCAEWRVPHDDLAAALAKSVALSSIKVDAEKYLLIIFWENQAQDNSQALVVNGYIVDHLGKLTGAGSAAFPINGPSWRSAYGNNSSLDP